MLLRSTFRPICFLQYYGYSPHPFTQLKTGPESEEQEKKKSPYLHPSRHLLLKGPVYTTVEKGVCLHIKWDWENM